MKNYHNISESLYFLNHEFEKDLATFFNNATIHGGQP
jgi:hypothetical protein